MSKAWQGILLTGASGNLGRAIATSKRFSNLLTPSHEEMDIGDRVAVGMYFHEHPIDAIIHCAALARMSECENHPQKALETNVIGTANLVEQSLFAENQGRPSIRFVHISTDGVYESTSGNYKETDGLYPYNKYGWTKLAAESAVRSLSNFCIIRTRFFDPQNIKFDRHPTDAFTSSIPIDELVGAIGLLLNHDFRGAINVGSERQSDFERFKAYKPSIQPCRLEDIQKNKNLPISADASMNINLWNQLKKNK